MKDILMSDTPAVDAVVGGEINAGFQRGMGGIRVMSEQSSKAREDYCPFMGLEYDQCYTVQMTSQAIPKILKFCAGDYENCDVYTQLSQRAK